VVVIYDDVLGDHCQNLFAKDREQVGLAARRRPFVGQQNL